MNYLLTSLPDAEEEQCPDDKPHKPHIFANSDGAAAQCPGVHDKRKTK